LSYPYVILGAGCAGLSLAWNLVELGVREPILLVDRREGFGNDRTWCFWDVEPTPFSDLATHAWSRWRVHDGRAEVVSECGEYPYLRLRSGDVFAKILDRLASAPNVSMALGRPILDVRETSRGVIVSTPGRQYVGGRVFDSSGRPLESPLPGRGARLLQHFLGQTIRTERPVFDRSCATLMDFRASQADGPHFVYVLPLSETEALVENTYLHPFDIDAGRHRLEIASYLRDRFGLAREEYTVIEEEAGAIPMFVGQPSRREGSKVEPIGLRGGAARPSSGYAFLRIQRQARRLAESIASGSDEPVEASSSFKYDVLDSIFLRVLADRPDLAPRIFGQMFERAEPAALVRFLSEKSTPIDDLRIVAALPKWPFITAATRMAWAARPT
jgi:lycopene beta-cyclase